jgi:hypothetical protein
VTGNAPTIVAGTSNLLIFSLSNPHYCSWTKPGSDCRMLNPTMVVPRIGNGWRRNECGFCSKMQLSEIPGRK